VILAPDERCSLVDLVHVDRLFRSRSALQAEIIVLRHQLNAPRRKGPKRLSFSNINPLVFAGLYQLAPGVLDALKIVTPETVIRWHRAGFRAYWRWKSRPRGGRPKTPAEVRQLIREMSVANPFVGSPADPWRTAQARHRYRADHGRKIHGEVEAATIARLETFLRSHADGIASMDLFVVPTVSFRLLYGFLILRHSRREILWLSVTAHPSTEWIARQLTEACGWSDRDTARNFLVGIHLVASVILLN